MKKIFFTCCLLLGTAGLFAQQEENTDPEKGKFKKENIFLGTSLNLGIAGNSFNLGLNPEIGYSIANWLDAGVSFNVNYFSQNASDYNSIRYRNLSLGGGPFIRLWPVNFLHVQVQPELNWISSSQKNMVSNQSNTYKFNSSSLLVGIGYGSRVIADHYSYITLMIDVLQNPNSPYRDRYNDPLPVFRAGFGFYLSKGRR